jgi:hypothetical protein
MEVHIYIGQWEKDRENGRGRKSLEIVYMEGIFKKDWNMTKARLGTGSEDHSRNISVTSLSAVNTEGGRKRREAGLYQMQFQRRAARGGYTESPAGQFLSW